MCVFGTYGRTYATGCSRVSKQIQESDSRISFTTGDVSAAEMDEAADALGFDSRAAFLREAVSELAAQAETTTADATLHQPDNDELQEAYDRLLELSDHPRGVRPVSVEEARDQLYTQRCPKAAVKDRLLRPLAEGGFISVSGGKIRVRRRTEEQVEQAEQEADAALERVESVSPSLPSSESLTTEQKQMRKYQRAGLDVPFRLGAWTAARVVWTDSASATHS